MESVDSYIYILQQKYIGQQVFNQQIIIDKKNFCMNTYAFLLGFFFS